MLDDMFLNYFWILKLVVCLTMRFKKEIRILSLIAKKLQVRQYLQNCLLQPGICKKYEFLANFKRKLELFCP